MAFWLLGEKENNNNSRCRNAKYDEESRKDFNRLFKLPALEVSIGIAAIKSLTTTRLCCCCFRWLIDFLSLSWHDELYHGWLTGWRFGSSDRRPGHISTDFYRWLTNHFSLLIETFSFCFDRFGKDKFHNVFGILSHPRFIWVFFSGSMVQVSHFSEEVFGEGRKEFLRRFFHAMMNERIAISFVIEISWNCD